MYRGILTTNNSTRIEKEQDTFIAILREMEALRNEHKHQSITSIDIYEDQKMMASLRLV